MKLTMDAAFRSMNKFSEVLCGDRVEILRREDSCLIILADGMGSGVRANIPATLTARILGTMFSQGAELSDCVETVIRTLPENGELHTAYVAFSLLSVRADGAACLAEFDNPACIFIRDGRLMMPEKKTRLIQGKEIREAHFSVQPGDALILMSDGALHAGAGMLLNYGWDWQEIADYALRRYAKTVSAVRLAADLCQACDELYEYRPQDDTTFACLRVGRARPVRLLTGPPQDPEKDAQMIADFMDGGADVQRILCGGTSAQIAARVLNRTLEAGAGGDNPDVPPVSKIAGIDLVTEGIITLSAAVRLLARYNNNQTVSSDFFLELDRDNGASRIAKILIEDCTGLALYVGCAMNAAYQAPGLPFELGIRRNLAEQLKEQMEAMGKPVTLRYY